MQHVILITHLTVLHHLPETFSHIDRGRPICMIQYERKLFTPISGREVAVPYRVSDDLPQSTQYDVTRLMSVCIVKFLKIVYV